MSACPAASDAFCSSRQSYPLDPSRHVDGALRDIQSKSQSAAHTITNMSTDPSQYSPISCEFHDRLEDLATVRKPTRIRYQDSDAAAQERDATITDVFSRGGAEYLSLSSGETLRLDQLVEVDGNKLADY